LAAAPSWTDARGWWWCGGWLVEVASTTRQQLLKHSLRSPTAPFLTGPFLTGAVAAVTSCTAPLTATSVSSTLQAGHTAPTRERCFFSSRLLVALSPVLLPSTPGAPPTVATWCCVHAWWPGCAQEPPGC
jgi:hypothetical protein